MAEWLDPENLEDPENTTQAPLNELAEESDQVVAEVALCPVGVEVGNVRNTGARLVVPVNRFKLDLRYQVSFPEVDCSHVRTRYFEST
jgi:hypothetical protein